MPTSIGMGAIVLSGLALVLASSASAAQTARTATASFVIEGRRDISYCTTVLDLEY